MARWNTLEESELDARTIYVGAYGFRDNDAIGHIWSRTLRGFDKAMARAINDTARTYQDFDSGETFGQTRDSIWYVGPFAQTVAETLMDLAEENRANELRDDIRTSSDGYVY